MPWTLIKTSGIQRQHHTDIKVSNVICWQKTATEANVGGIKCFTEDQCMLQNKILAQCCSNQSLNNCFFWEKVSHLGYPHYLPHVLLNCTSKITADHNIQI